MSNLYGAIEGGEFDWFAVDSAGFVGHFSTAGFGPVPALLLAQLPRIEGLAEAMRTLPIRGDASGHLPGNIADWLEMARRGCYSFDWQHWRGPYRRAASPSCTLNWRDLPAALAALVRLVEFPEICFAELSEIRPEWLCPCEQAPQAVAVLRSS